MTDWLLGTFIATNYFRSLILIAFASEHPYESAGTRARMLTSTCMRASAWIGVNVSVCI